MVGWFTVPRGAYRVVAGTPTSYRSSPHAIRTFCGTCGTPLTFESTRFPDETDVTICSLDDPGRSAARSDDAMTIAWLGSRRDSSSWTKHGRIRAPVYPDPQALSVKLVGDLAARAGSACRGSLDAPERERLCSLSAVQHKTLDLLHAR